MLISYTLIIIGHYEQKKNKKFRFDTPSQKYVVLSTIASAYKEKFFQGRLHQKVLQCDTELIDDGFWSNRNQQRVRDE